VLVRHALLSQYPVTHWLLIGVVTLASALMTLTAYRLTVGVFLGAPRGDWAQHHAGPPQRWDPLWVSPLVLAGAALVLGLLGAGSATGRLAEAISSNPDAHVHLSLVPHYGTELLLWGATLLLAGALGRVPQLTPEGSPRLRSIPSAIELWQAGLGALASIGEAFSRRWENGSLRWYLAGTIMTLPALLVVAFETDEISYGAIVIGLQDVSWIGLLLCGLLVLAAATAVQARTRLAAAIASSTVGFLVAMLFVVYRSPDILLTQILIETASTIFMLLVLIHLPAFPRHDLTPAARMVNGIIAGSVGLAVTVLLLLGMTPGLRETDNIATRPGGLLARSFAEGGGQNAVNVIIVDIRAIDTTGEVTVLVVVCLCVYGLLHARRRAA
jgi:multisubunit Na+/H+ antiporter MnhB subunit